MSALNIRDLSFIEELDTCELKIAGAASAGAGAAAGGGDAVAGAASTDDGTVYVNAQGRSSYYDYYYGGGSSGPSVFVDTYQPYYY